VLFCRAFLIDSIRQGDTPISYPEHARSQVRIWVRVVDTLDIFRVDSEEFLYRFYNYRILHFSSEFNKNLENGEYSSDDVGCVNQK
jgi:hypothetical protein